MHSKIYHYKTTNKIINTKNELWKKTKMARLHLILTKLSFCVKYLIDLPANIYVMLGNLTANWSCILLITMESVGRYAQ